MRTPSEARPEKLRIAILSPYAHHAGHHWAIARELGRALLAKGHHVEIITTTDPIEPIEPNIAENVHRVLSPRGPRVLRTGGSLGHNLETMICTLYALRRHRMRPFHVWHFVDATYVSLFFAALTVDAAMIYHLWGGIEFQPSAGGRRSVLAGLRSVLARQANRRGRLAMVCETEATRRLASRNFPNHVHQIPYAARSDIQTGNRIQARRILGISEEDFVLLMYGTHREGKDYDTVVRGAKLANLKVCLLFVGKTISANDPAIVVARHDFHHAVIVEKFVDAEETCRYFAACDAVVLPYSGDYTKGSGVLVEAAQFQRPSIASDTGFLRSFLDENRSGFVFKQGDPEDFAKVLIRLANLSEPEKAELSGNIARTASRYSWDTVVEQYLTLYRQYF
jgi:glycosyltransferase involved in cell wall biosynthesis